MPKNPADLIHFWASCLNPRSLLALAAIWLWVATICIRADDTRNVQWTDLFDGTTLAGWEVHGEACDFYVVNREIVGPSVRSSFLCTKRTFRNFILELEVKIPEGLNSGIQIRSAQASEPSVVDWNGKTIEIPKGRVYGYQIEIDPSPRAWTAGLYEEGRRGWLVTLEKNEAARRAYRSNEWNGIRIVCRGASIKTWINGVPAVDTTDDWPPREGFIGLQVQGRAQSPLEVRFRNIRIQEIQCP